MTRNDKTLSVLPLAVLQIDIDGSTVDETTDAGDNGSADWTVLPATEAIGDMAAICQSYKHGRVVFDSAGGTAGIGGTGTWKYLAPDGSWQPLTGVVDGTSGFTAAAADGQVLTFDTPADWDEQTLVGASGEDITGYWIAFVVDSVYATNPVYDQCYVGGFDGEGDRGRVAPGPGAVDGPGGADDQERFILTHASIRVVSGAVTSWRLIKWDPVADVEVSEIDSGLALAVGDSVDFSGGIAIPLSQAGTGSCEVRWIVTGQTGTVRCMLDGRVS
jgi:hypothetical protein